MLCFHIDFQFFLCLSMGHNPVHCLLVFNKGPIVLQLKRASDWLVLWGLDQQNLTQSLINLHKRMLLLSPKKSVITKLCLFLSGWMLFTSMNVQYILNFYNPDWGVGGYNYVYSHHLLIIGGRMEYRRGSAGEQCSVFGYLWSTSKAKKWLLSLF